MPADTVPGDATNTATAANIRIFQGTDPNYYRFSLSYSGFTAGGGDVMYFRPKVGGAYRVSISHGNSYESMPDNRGGYTAGIVAIPADIDTTGPVAVSVGQTVASELATSSDTDSFTLSLAAGQSYLFSVTAPHELWPNVGWADLSLAGAPAGVITQGTGYLRFKPAHSGTYRVVVHGSGGSYVMSSETVGDAGMHKR